MRTVQQAIGKRKKKKQNWPHILLPNFNTNKRNTYFN